MTTTALLTAVAIGGALTILVVYGWMLVSAFRSFVNGTETRERQLASVEMAKLRWLQALAVNVEDAGLNELRDQAHSMARAKGWYDGVPEAKDARPEYAAQRLMLMVSELAEALEEIRNGHAIAEVYHPNWSAVSGLGKPEGVPVELADCLIRILDFAGYYGIDLEAVVLEKMAYNSTRPYRHGGKAA